MKISQHKYRLINIYILCKVALIVVVVFTAAAVAAIARSGVVTAAAASVAAVVLFSQQIWWPFSFNWKVGDSFIEGSLLSK